MIVLTFSSKFNALSPKKKTAWNYSDEKSFLQKKNDYTKNTVLLI